MIVPIFLFLANLIFLKMKKIPILIILSIAFLVFGGQALTKASSNIVETEQSLVQFAETDSLVRPLKQNIKTGEYCCGNTQYSYCSGPLCVLPN